MARPVTIITTFGQESEFSGISIYFSNTIQSYIVEAISKIGELEDVIIVFPTRKYAHNRDAKALQAALRMAETLADISTL